jgi:uncharacterized protein (DUF736 family)
VGSEDSVEQSRGPIGAAWQRTSKDNTVYHSVKLDDPSFSAPIYANLVAVDDGYALVWSR